MSFTELKSKCHHGWFLTETSGKSSCLVSSSFWWWWFVCFASGSCWLACGHIISTSALVVPLPSLLCGSIFLCIALLRIFVMAFRALLKASQSVQWLSCVWLCDPIDYSTPGFPVHYQLLELAQTHVHELVMPSNHVILSCPLLLLPSVFPSIRVFSNESVLHIRWSKYWSFSISPSNKYSGLTSFRIDWFDLFAVQGTLKSSPATQFESINSGAQPSLWSNAHICTWLLEKP